MLRWTHTLIDLRTTIISLGASDFERSRHRVWTDETEKVLILHRWSEEGQAALLILGFNKAPATLTLREPVGTWNLRLDSASQEFGGTRQDSLPKQLVFNPDGVSMDVPAYTAVLSLASS